MAVAALKEALRLLSRDPVLWTPGLVGGAIGAGLWILYNLTGTFFTSRLLVIFALVLLFFIAGMIQILRSGKKDLRSLLSGGMHSFFRVLLPQLVIVFTIMLILFAAMVPLTLAGVPSDPSAVSFIMTATAIPIVMLTFFFDVAAIFEDRRVFDSIARSIQIVVNRSGQVALFYLLSAGVFLGIIFSMMVLWEAFLYDRLQPLLNYNETQIQAFTPDQLVALIGPSGMWITAGIIFITVTLLIPVLLSFKVCFFRSISGEVIPIQQVAGEYDSKGRWYKY